MFKEKTISIKERRLLFVNIPVIVSSSLQGAVNVEKLLRFYERIFAYHYMRHLVDFSKTTGNQITYRLAKLYNLFIPLSFAVGITAFTYLAFKSKYSVGDVLKFLMKGEVKPLMEQIILEQRGDLDMTRVVVGDSIYMFFVAHITNRENLSPREILMNSIKKGHAPIFEKDVLYYADSETKVIQIAFNKPTYITTLVEYEELKQSHGNITSNFVLIDFSTNEVIVLMLDNSNHHIRYSTTINEILEKPQVADVNLNQLLSLLKGVSKE